MRTRISMSLENIIKKKFQLKNKGKLLIYPFILGFSFLINIFILIFNKEGSIIYFVIKKIN